MKKRINNTNLFIIKGDALKERTDMLVNWTVPRLNGGDAFFFRLHEEGGSTIYKDCQRVLTSFSSQGSQDGYVPVGKAVVTTAGILPAKLIIHAVIPDFRAMKPDEEHKALLSSTLNNVFLLISQYNSVKERVNKVIFVPISPFIYGSKYNLDAVKTLVSSLLAFAERSDVRTIKIICETSEDYKLYSKELYKQTSSGLKRFIDKLFKLSV